jgi:hypothetical protein
MQLTHKSCPDFCPQRSAPTLGSPRRSIAVAVILAASLAAAACGSSGSPTILNTEKVERAIESSALTQRRAHAAVSCPSGVPQKMGFVFSCTAIVGHVSTQFVVTELDGSGDVHYVAR